MVSGGSFSGGKAEAVVEELSDEAVNGFSGLYRLELIETARSAGRRQKSLGNSSPALVEARALGQGGEQVPKALAGKVASVEPGEELLPRAHRAVSNLKAWMHGTHRGVSDAHLQVYLDEYVFRHNRRRTPMASFQTLLGLSTQHEPITYRDISDRAA